MHRNVFSFDGRISGAEYALSIFIALAIYFTVSYFYGPGYWPMAIFWFVFAQGAKREHDLDNSGWWQLIPFRFIWLTFLKGQSGMNRFGNEPKKFENFYF
jgi:uncharacterized membrane protein YhaH (DUF805 family)